jgi:GNAT superfamily N-acetyltransferase/DNA-binding MarR family transcriptional regulator
MDFYQQAGKIALGSRLRRLGERFTEAATQIFALYQVPLDPKWFPVFYVLSQGQASVSEIAQSIGQSHAAVSQVVKEMTKQGLTITTKSAADGRVSVVQLSEQGQQIIPKIAAQYLDVEQAVEELLSEMQHNLWKAIEETEFLLNTKDFYTRVQAKRKVRVSQQVEIIDYEPQYAEAFKQLNYAWIEKHFKVEIADQESLNSPDKKILQSGGWILLARYHSEIVGTCALIKLTNQRYELAKMTVAEHARGNNIGWLLGRAAIQKARELGAKTLYLESNTKLEPAIRLYQKLGFQRVVGQPSPYERCNIQMELQLT